MLQLDKNFLERLDTEVLSKPGPQISEQPTSARKQKVEDAIENENFEKNFLKNLPKKQVSQKSADQFKFPTQYYGVLSDELRYHFMRFLGHKALDMKTESHDPVITVQDISSTIENVAAQSKVWKQFVSSSKKLETSFEKLNANMSSTQQKVTALKSAYESSLIFGDPKYSDPTVMKFARMHCNDKELVGTKNVESPLIFFFVIMRSYAILRLQPIGWTLDYVIKMAEKVLNFFTVVVTRIVLFLLMPPKLHLAKAVEKFMCEFVGSEAEKNLMKNEYGLELSEEELQKIPNFIFVQNTIPGQNNSAGHAFSKLYQSTCHIRNKPDPDYTIFDGNFMEARNPLGRFSKKDDFFRAITKTLETPEVVGDTYLNDEEKGAKWFSESDLEKEEGSGTVTGRTQEVENCGFWNVSETFFRIIEKTGAAAGLSFLPKGTWERRATALSEEYILASEPEKMYGSQNTQSPKEEEKKE